MINAGKRPYAIASVFIWIGFLGAISFMEAWLKFQAPGITLPLGLGIGRLVFQALNKVEWILATIIVVSTVLSGYNGFKKGYITLLIPVGLILLQTFWLLPALDSRAEIIINGDFVPPSNLHLYYVVMEVVKMTCLIILGITLLKMKKS